MLAVIAMTELAVYGDGTRGRDGLRVRAAAAGLFEVSKKILKKIDGVLINLGML